MIDEKKPKEEPPTWTALIVTTALTSFFTFLIGFMSGHISGAMMILNNVVDK